ncbi:MAG: ATP-binding protein [Candidatus Diapherotrites archaeon]|uniref:ATP-binding protein n=1 Tax=Candidatus Iainarchaeum sp. TaxID=3101447 RepID=A0A8T3YJ17_9ARCH|nr:ATP-binding protein [Candidatus Diapherotrites archaeon]
MKFYDREAEFKTLGKIRDNFRIAVIGRRRIGKTSLVENFYGKKCVTLFVSSEKAEKEIVKAWIKEYSAYGTPNVSTFKDFFDFVFAHMKDKVIFVDELQNFLKVNKSAIFDLQRAIDKHKPKLVVSGSIISLMKKLVEGYKSPLYGRFDFIIKLNELDFRTVFEICKDLSLGIEEAFRIYAVFGGVPKYYELIEKSGKFGYDDFMLDSFVRYPRPLYEEVRTMLKEEFGKEHKTFFSILSAISQGNNKHSEIAGYIGKKQTEITKYLSMLKEDYELIERKTPVVEGKKGLYAIRNNLFAFWFGSIWKYNELIETLQEAKAMGIIKNNLERHNSLTFEKTITGLISQKILLPEHDFSKIGRQWGKFKGETGKNTYEIDIMAIDEDKKEALFAECKWQENLNPEKIIKELKDKARHVKWEENERKETYAVFAKSFSKKITVFEGKEAMCIDLKGIEKTLNKSFT